MELLIPYLKAFLVGGAFCAVGQVFIDYTKLTPARILVAYVVAGVILGGLGVYQPIIDFAGDGAAIRLWGAAGQGNPGGHRGKGAAGGALRGAYRLGGGDCGGDILRPAGGAALPLRG